MWKRVTSWYMCASSLSYMPTKALSLWLSGLRACVYTRVLVCVWLRLINHVPFFNSDSSSWQQIWFWPLKSRHVVERRLQDLRFAMPLKENVWMGLLIRKQLEAIPHRHENSMHLPYESQTDWRGCDVGSVPITQRAKRAEWLTMIKCKRVCKCHSLKHISYVSLCGRVGQSLSIKRDRMSTRMPSSELRIKLCLATPEVSRDSLPCGFVMCTFLKCRSAQQ